MKESLRYKLAMQQTAKIAEQTDTYRQSQMQIMQMKTKPTHPIILIIALTKFICLVIFIPVATEKLPKEHMKQLQTECTMNLMVFPRVWGSLKVHFPYKQGQPSISGATQRGSLHIAEATKRIAETATEAANYCSVRC